jgi:uncharacterized protein YdeI (YjbR/CyaY-like superfamily)
VRHSPSGGVLKPRSFATPRAFRAWLAAHHAAAAELLVRLWKVHARDRGLTYAQALDEVLCFGWIDGVRRALDRDSFTIRFSPRKPRSIWSAINIRHVRRLIAEGRMEAAGLAAFRARDPRRSRVYSFESRPRELAPAYEKRLLAHRAAWAFLSAQAPWYRRTTSFWVMSAKREETRERRLEQLIACSAAGRAIGPLAGLEVRRPGKRLRRGGRRRPSR